MSKRSFSRNFFHHQTSPVKLVYFFLIRFSQQVLLEESWRLLCRRFHSIGPWLCPIRDRFGFCCSNKPEKSYFLLDVKRWNRTNLWKLLTLLWQVLKKDNKGKCLSVLALAFQCIILWIVEKNYKCAILKEES